MLYRKTTTPLPTYFFYIARVGLLAWLGVRTEPGNCRGERGRGVPRNPLLSSAKMR